MSFVDAISERCETPLVIAFLSLNGYTVQASKLPDATVADTVNDYYELVDGHVIEAGGHVVKFIGDGALVVFPMERADSGICALLDLKTAVDRWYADRDWSCRMVVRVHAASVIAGPFGSGANTRFDVIGNAVNIAATVRTNGVALTAEAFRKLSEESRKRFKKHTPPVTYIPSEDRHPHRTGR
jgi:class 3 adenylate cyclase